MSIYFDNAATTAVLLKVTDRMMEYFLSEYGNAGSTHILGMNAAEAVEEARERIAYSLSCKSDEIYFTSGGTESDNWAIQSAIETTGKKHIISSVIEHKAILAKLQSLEKHGISCTLLPVDENGRVNPNDLLLAVRPDTALVTIMMANNEIGTIQPISQLSSICREKEILFHTDAVQAFGKIPFQAQIADMISISAHKINGPKGIGALYVRSGVQMAPLLHGGGQEGGLRPGTLPVPLAVGFGYAAENLGDYIQVTALTKRLEDGILNSIPTASLIAASASRVPGISNFSFEGIESHSLVKSLSYRHDICCSSGSACSAKTTKPSYVLRSCGLSVADCHSSVRFSLGRLNTEKEIDFLLSILPDMIVSLGKNI
jgi:cysteine desulfurase